MIAPGAEAITRVRICNKGEVCTRVISISTIGSRRNANRSTCGWIWYCGQTKTARKIGNSTTLAPYLKAGYRTCATYVSAPVTEDVTGVRNGDNLQLNPGSIKVPITTIWTGIAINRPRNIWILPQPQMFASTGWFYICG